MTEELFIPQTQDKSARYAALTKQLARMAKREANVTAVMAKNKDMRKALNLTDEWKKATNGSSVLTQGCLVVRSEVTDDTLKSVLSDYETSIKYMTDTANLDAAAKLAAKYGIVASEPIAKAAIPDCSMVFISDPNEMREALSGYFEVLYAADKTSVGGSVPDDAFYR